MDKTGRAEESCFASALCETLSFPGLRLAGLILVPGNGRRFFGGWLLVSFIRICICIGCHRSFRCLCLLFFF